MKIYMLPTELLHSIESSLDFESWCNLCCVFVQASLNSSALSVPRLKRLMFRFTSLTDEAKTETRASKIVSIKSRKSIILQEFEIALLFVRAIEGKYWQNNVGVRDIVSIFDNMLLAEAFLVWHSTSFDNVKNLQLLRHISCSDIANCGRCIAASGIEPFSRSYTWQDGGWPVVRKEAANILTFIDTVQVPVLSPLNYLAYNDTDESFDYYVLWPYGYLLGFAEFQHMKVVLTSDIRRRIDRNALLQATQFD